MTKTQVLEELRRELATRKRVYPTWIQQNKLHELTAKHRIKCIEAAIELIAGKTMNIHEARQAGLFDF